MLNQTEISHVSLGPPRRRGLHRARPRRTLAKLALGLADDLVTTTCLATRAPLVIAPAMDADMYDHPAVAANVQTLRERGATIVEPGYGRMASGLVGQGRLAEPPVIVDTLRIVLARNGDLAGWRVVVTAGGTQEAIDPVRYVSNRPLGEDGVRRRRGGPRPWRLGGADLDADRADAADRRGGPPGGERGRHARRGDGGPAGRRPPGDGGGGGRLPPGQRWRSRRSRSGTTT